MIEIIADEHRSLISSLFTDAKEKIRIISPFLSKRTANMLCTASKNGINCSFITRFYLQDFVDGSNTLDGLQDMMNAGVKLFALVGLHTKLYLFDYDDAIVGSANFTEGGLIRNVELSVHLRQEPAVDDLQEYYDDIIYKVEQADEGVITQDMLDDYKARYIKLINTKSTLAGGKSIVTTVRGAVLDWNANQIREDKNKAFNEIDSSANERLTDPVYSALDGEISAVSHKNLRNIILKFSASSKNRDDGNKPMRMDAFDDNGKKVYTSHFSVARLKSAKTVEDGDEVFFCVHSYDKNGKGCPLIVGKGFFRAYNANNDARKKVWARQYEWIKDYPIYCVVSEAKIINAPVNCGIPLRDLTEELGYKTYMHTRNNPDKYSTDRVANSHGQQAMLALSPEAKEYLDKRLDEIGQKYGWTTYKSE